MLSLPLYLLCGLARRRRLISQEAAVKYFLLGAFTSAIFAYGLAMLYGYWRSTQFAAVAAQARAGDTSDVLLLGGLALVVVGLLFKASVGPFHLWTPDVYQGAPTPVTAFMAACTKVAAFRRDAAGVPGRPGADDLDLAAGARGDRGRVHGDRLRHRHHPDRHEAHAGYSSVAHAGFILLGVISMSQTGASATMFYLLTTAWPRSAPSPSSPSSARATGRPRTSPTGPAWPAARRSWPASMSLFLLSFAGIPLTAGFIGKLSVFTAAMEAGLGPWVVLAMIATAITAFFYLRIVVVMYFADPVTPVPAEQPVGVAAGAAGGAPAAGRSALAAGSAGGLPPTARSWSCPAR